MKQVMKLVLGITMAVISVLTTQGQGKKDAERMEKDVEVAENILSTLLRQQMGRRNFFPVEVSGDYLDGYGVTFRLPQSRALNIFFMKSDGAPNIAYDYGQNGSYSYSYSYSQDAKVAEGKAKQEATKARIAPPTPPKTRVVTGKGISGTTVTKVDNDSLMESVQKKFMEVSKDFLADYGDVISQLSPEERIVITNKSDEFGGDFGFAWKMGGAARRTMMSVEAKREDIVQLKQGKITRDQFLSKLKIVNTETDDKLDPDLEVLSSMFGRLYREDLSKTFYTQGDVSYERMKDYGVIYYMRVYSSTREGDRFMMPTASMNDASQEERDEKVKELYPKFESELKENFVEYGRTLRSLKDDEQVILNTKLTQCEGCGIPSTLELSVKNSVLKDYSAGKITKEAALAKVGVKKVGMQ